MLRFMAPRDKKTKLQIALEQHQLQHQPCPWPVDFPYVACAIWDVELGHNPVERQRAEFYGVDPFFEKDANIQLFQERFLPLFPCLDGHNLAALNSAARTLEIDDKVPVSPLFARDLTGRIIHIGYGPEHKTKAEWFEKAEVTFPRNCRDVTVKVEGADLIENVFFTRFRTLDHTPKLAYSSPENYPYKLRLDTFYQDGWRLPQTELVYARSGKARAKKLGEELLAKWDSRSEGESYEDFYEKIGGEAHFEQLFEKGCTLIPTFEAANGYNQVSDDFELQDFWPGRAVEGLHDIVDMQQSDAPKGTILEVQCPGFVTEKYVSPAKVVVSDGSSYKTPHSSDPQPMLPDLRLPHQRAAAKWESMWLPTHPSHFEAPALWGWGEQTGRFLQQSGPVWDPLHYFYASQPLVLRAFRQPLAGNAFLAKVPEVMKTRFYPIVPMSGRDEMNLEVFAERRAMGYVPTSRVSHALAGETADVGYHPMPAWFEYEFDSFAFPELAPQNRVSAPPADLEPRLAPCIKVEGEKVEFPELVRYQKGARLPKGQQWPLYKPDYNDRLYRHLGDELWRTPAQIEFVNSLTPGFLGALLEWKEKAKENRLLKQGLMNSSAAWVQLGTWQSLSPKQLVALSRQQLMPEEEKAA
jgi:hypothetical protein